MGRSLCADNGMRQMGLCLRLPYCLEIGIHIVFLRDEHNCILILIVLADIHLRMFIFCQALLGEVNLFLKF